MDPRTLISRDEFLQSVPPQLRVFFLHFREPFLSALQEERVKNPNYLAYLIATAQLESGFKSIKEVRAGENQPTLRRLQDRYWATGFYGRGYVQLTWKQNYAKMGQVLNLPLETEPDLALIPENAARILVVGMTRGLFTGLRLSDFDWYGSYDFVHARRIVNGLDRAEEFANVALRYLFALSRARKGLD